MAGGLFPRWDLKPAAGGLEMRFYTLIALLLAFAAAGFAQTAGGTITGTVTDQTGAVVANAMVQAKHVETGTVYDTAATSTGNYTVSQLPVGTYEITATVPGFKKYTRGGIVLTVASVVRIDMGLEVGNATESVTVNQAAPLLETESGELSHNVQTTRMDDLPILGQGSSIAGSSGISDRICGTAVGSDYEGERGSGFVEDAAVRG